MWETTDLTKEIHLNLYTIIIISIKCWILILMKNSEINQFLIVTCCFSKAGLILYTRYILISSISSVRLLRSYKQYIYLGTWALIECSLVHIQTYTERNRHRDRKKVFTMISRGLVIPVQYATPLCMGLPSSYVLWHYRLWSFKTRDTKLERFLH